MKFNDETTLNPHLMEALRERLDRLLSAGSPEARSLQRNWIAGALSALCALTGEIWELKQVKDLPLFYIEDEDGAQRVTPEVLDQFR